LQGIVSRRALLLGAALLSMTSLSAAVCAQKERGKDEPAPAKYVGPKKRLAVMNMEFAPETGGRKSEYAELIKRLHKVNTRSDASLRLGEMLTTALDSTGRFVLVDRANIDDIRSEIAVGQELGNEKTVVKKGNVLGAQILVRCAVTEFTDERSQSRGGISLGGVQIGGGGKTAAVTVDIKMVDASSSRVLYTGSATGDSKSKDYGGGLSLGKIGLAFGKSESEPIEKATRMAIQKAVEFIVEKMEKVAWEGRVASAEANRLVINRGEEDGLREGDRLGIYRPGKAIEDPETGEILGRDEDTMIGEARVTWTDKRVARLVPLRGEAFQKGDVIKYAEGR
jgi:curli biogenesis system outer membrane secretion channel CsgG